MIKGHMTDQLADVVLLLFEAFFRSLYTLEFDET
jgi:hypothetical protein